MPKKIEEITSEGKKRFSKVTYTDGSVGYFNITLAECARRMDKLGLNVVVPKK